MDILKLKGLPAEEFKAAIMALDGANHCLFMYAATPPASLKSKLMAFAKEGYEPIANFLNEQILLLYRKPINK